MVALNYAFIGAEIPPTSLKIDENEFVGELKKVVKAKNAATVAADALDLQLFVAKKQNGEWMDAEHAKSIALDEHGRPQGLVEMDPLLRIKSVIPWPRLDEGQLHVLVVLSSRDRKRLRRSEGELPPRKLTYLQKLLKSCKKLGDLPGQGEFSKLFEWGDGDCGKVKDIQAIGDIVEFTGSQVYVRKEILCVLEHFKHFVHVKLGRTTEVNPKKQFILMGSAGTGKSSILAMICFYLAIVIKVPVVWFRVNDDEPVTRVLDQGKYYEWIDRDGTIYENLCMTRSGIDQERCWFCLDGLTQQEIKEQKLESSYTLLATSGEFQRKGERGANQVTCLVPYWRQEDLKDLAKKLEQSDESDFSSRYCVSGGSLRDFLLPVADASDLVSTAVRDVNSDTADLLLRTSCRDVELQNNRIRMIGVTDTTDPKQYICSSAWRSCVTSMKALQHLVDVVQPDFFQKFVVVAKELKDPRLRSIGLRYFFHSLERWRHAVEISYWKYHDVTRAQSRHYADILHEETRTLTFGQSTGPDRELVTCEGGTMKDYVAVMKKWAANPTDMNYWVPASSSCETIDAVAKWELRNEDPEEKSSTEYFCLLQLTNGSTQKLDEKVLWEFAKPFLEEKKHVCYMVLLFGEDNVRGMSAEDKKWRFRLDPEKITMDRVKEHVPLYVATYKSVI